MAQTRIVISGTTGESATLTEDEHMECVKFAIEQHVRRQDPGYRRDRFQLHALRGGDVIKEAAEDGADGLLVVTPYDNQASTGRGSIAHYEG